MKKYPSHPSVAVPQRVLNETPSSPCLLFSRSNWTHIVSRTFAYSLPSTRCPKKLCKYYYLTYKCVKIPFAQRDRCLVHSHLLSTSLCMNSLRVLKSSLFCRASSVLLVSTRVILCSLDTTRNPSIATRNSHHRQWQQRLRTQRSRKSSLACTVELAKCLLVVNFPSSIRVMKWSRLAKSIT